MNLKDALQRIEELEKRVRELEARPPMQYHYHYPQPQWPYQPYYPQQPLQPVVTPFIPMYGTTTIGVIS